MAERPPRATPGASPAPGVEPPRDAEPGPVRTLLVALVVCGVCSAVVTSAVVLLRPYQVANRQGESRAKVAALVAGLPGLSELLEPSGVPRAEIQVRVVELASGAYAPDVDPTVLLETPEDEREGRDLAPGEDPAGVRRVPRYAPVYELRRDGTVHTVILPVRGQGYLAAIHGFLAVAGDGNTVRGITFTEHEETPGLGGEIDAAEWRARWQGKALRGPEGDVRIRVVESAPKAGAPEARFEVQGIGGATRTSDGVSDLVRFWVGPRGFGPFLRRISKDSEEDEA